MLVIEKVWGTPIVFVEPTGGKMDGMEIEIEQVLYIDGKEVSTRRETYRTSDAPGPVQRFWAAIENNAKDFRQAINAYEEPPF